MLSLALRQYLASVFIMVNQHPERNILTRGWSDWKILGKFPILQTIKKSFSETNKKNTTFTFDPQKRIYKYPQNT